VHIPSLRNGRPERVRIQPVTIVPPIVPINISDDGEEEVQKHVKVR
jgi:hypothetical protein